jgi:hypothetical protein
MQHTSETRTRRVRRRAVVPAAVVLAAAWAVGGPPAARTAAAYDVKTVESPGSIEGWVRFGDQYPKPKTVTADRDVEACGTEHESEKFVVDPETKGLKNVVITLEGVTAGKPFPEGALTVDQAGCRYDPHVQIAYLTEGGAADGVDLTVTNDDDVFHNVHAYGEADETVFNEASLPDTDVKERLEAPGVYHLQCDVHSWMSAWIVVTDTPYATRTDETGTFRIDGVPPGSYTLHIWHEGLGSVDRDVTVEAGQATTVTFPLGKNK